jgi:hypothetical protein
MPSRAVGTRGACRFQAIAYRYHPHGSTALVCAYKPRKGHPLHHGKGLLGRGFALDFFSAVGSLGMLGNPDRLARRTQLCMRYY